MVGDWPARCRRVLSGVAGAIGMLVLCGSTGLAQAPAAEGVEIAVALSLTGPGASHGLSTLEGVQLAIDEANAEGLGPPITIATYDDQSSDEEATRLAARIAQSPAALVIGPTFSTASLAAGPIYAEAGLASLPATATSDRITDSATTFRMLFRNSEQGEMLAVYLDRVFGQRRAAVIDVDNAYSRSLREGFQKAAESLDIDAQYYRLETEADAERVARQIAADTPVPPIVLLTLGGKGASILTALRRLGVDGPFLGDDALSDDAFARRFAAEPEEQDDPGFFTDGFHAVSPMILDSTNAEVLSFAARFRARHGRQPVWSTVAGFDAGRLAVAAIRRATQEAGMDADAQTLRAAVLDYLRSLDRPQRALPGLLGPIWFDNERGRHEAIRLGLFDNGRFESAPLQVIPVMAPASGEIASGNVFETPSGHYHRMQRVVYTGVYINDIPRIDVVNSTFEADFYLWLRYAPDNRDSAGDPTDIRFLNMTSGDFDPARPAEQGLMPDGMEYRLWRVRGEFRNDYDLRNFPFDHQALLLPFFNARAATDRIVYVVDNRAPESTPAGPPAAHAHGESEHAAAERAIVSANAFHNLSRWVPIGVSERRESLVTPSALGDLRRAGIGSNRELSGFLVTIELQRRAVATLIKMLAPLLLMTIIMFASLFFPLSMVREKVAVAVTSALAGTVLLTSISSQLGPIGYTIMLEYAFYVYFGLSFLAIVSVLGAEHLRAGGREDAAIRVSRWFRSAFMLVILCSMIAAYGYWYH